MATQVDAIANGQGYSGTGPFTAMVVQPLRPPMAFTAAGAAAAGGAAATHAALADYSCLGGKSRSIFRLSRTQAWGAVGLEPCLTGSFLDPASQTQVCKGMEIMGGRGGDPARGGSRRVMWGS